MRVFATQALLVMLAFQAVFLFNFFKSLFWGDKAPMNPWRGSTLEWTVPSPPPHGNFAVMPTVYRGPYEYSHPDREEDFWPQDEPPKPTDS
jgi:cytochrome c oxidase subunit 1